MVKLMTNFVYPGNITKTSKKGKLLESFMASSVGSPVSLSKAVQEIYSIVNPVVYAFDNRLTKRHYRCLKFKVHSEQWMYTLDNRLTEGCYKWGLL